MEQDLVQVRSPRTGRWLLIDRAQGIILEHREVDGPYPGIEKATRGEAAYRGRNPSNEGRFVGFASEYIPKGAQVEIDLRTQEIRRRRKIRTIKDPAQEGSITIEEALAAAKAVKEERGGEMGSYKGLATAARRAQKGGWLQRLWRLINKRGK